MEIKIVTGQRNADLAQMVRTYNNVEYYPESKKIHPYNLVDNILELCEKHYNQNQDLIIVTYSEIVLDAIRLWGARTAHCDIVECINVLDNGETHIAKLNKFGGMDFWEDGVFDIKSVILKELLKIRKSKDEDSKAELRR